MSTDYAPTTVARTIDRPRHLTRVNHGELDLAYLCERTGNPHLRILGNWPAQLQIPSCFRQSDVHLESLAPRAVLVHTGPPVYRQLVVDPATACDAAAIRPSGKCDAGDVAWTIVAHWLSKITGIDVESLTFGNELCPRCLSKRGRPALEQVSGLYFSLSRSEEIVAVAVAPSPVGVDVQVHGPTNHELLRSLHRTERAFIRRQPDQVVLTRCWTRKEAVLKAMGVGVAHGVSHPLVGAGLSPFPVDGYELHDIALTSRFAAAIAHKPLQRKAAQ